MGEIDRETARQEDNMASPLCGIVLLLCAFAPALGMWAPELEVEGAFQGDIILDPDEFEQGWNKSKETTYASIKGGRWPNGVVPYYIEGSARGASGVIKKAINDYHKYTCIRFKPRTNERTYISFYKGKGCSSPIGYRSGRVNRI